MNDKGEKGGGCVRVTMKGGGGQAGLGNPMTKEVVER